MSLTGKVNKLPVFIIKFSVLLALVCIPYSGVHAQISSAQDTTNKVVIDHADNSVTHLSDSLRVRYLKGNVQLVYDSMYMFCDSAIVYENEVIAIGNVIFIQNDTINIFSDSLYYSALDKKADLFGNVIMRDGSKKLFTQTMFYNLDLKQATFPDTITLQDSTMVLSSLEGFYDAHLKDAIFRHEVNLIDDNAELATDSLRYDLELDQAYFIAPTFINKDSKKIYCSDGYYNTVEGSAYLGGKPLVLDGSQEGRAEHITFNSQDSIVVFDGNAVLTDSLETAKGDRIEIYEKTGDVILIGEAFYKNEEKEITGPYIQYNEKTGDINLEGRSRVWNGASHLDADSIRYLKELDNGIAIGDVVWVDTIDNRKIESDVIRYKEKENYYKAYRINKRPLFTQQIDADTMYLSADTLVSSEKDSIKSMLALRKVKIFKTDVQAICDSLHYSDIDSTFRLYINPVSWSDTTQFSGDTIDIRLEKDDVREIFAREHAFIVTKETEDYYNQIKGKIIHAFLDSNKIKLMKVKGNAESIYFIRDKDDAFVGPDYTKCSHMDFHFKNEELEDIYFYTEPECVLTPMRQASQQQLYLEGFEWKEKLRPQSGRQIVHEDNQSINVTNDIFEEKVESIFKKENQKSEVKKNESKKPMRKNR